MANSKVSINFRASTKSAVKNIDSLKTSLSGVAGLGEGLPTSENVKKLANEAKKASSSAENLTKTLSSEAQIPNAPAEKFEEVAQAADKATKKVEQIAPAAEKVASASAEVANVSRDAEEAIGGIANSYKGLNFQGSKAMEDLDKMHDRMLVKKEQLGKTILSGDATKKDVAAYRAVEEQLNRLYDTQAMLAGEMSKTDYWNKWETSAVSGIDKVLEFYPEAGRQVKELSKEEQKATAQSAKMDKSLEARAVKFKHAQLLKTGSVEDLQEALKHYEVQLATAVKGEDKLATHALQEKIAQTQAAIERRTTTVNNATRAEMRRNAEILRSGSVMRRAGSEAVSSIAMLITGGKGLTAVVRGLGAAIKSALGPMVVIFIAMEAAMWALGKVWDAAKGWFTSGADSAEEAAEAIKTQKEELEGLRTELDTMQAKTAFFAEMRVNTEATAAATEKITSNYKAQIALIDAKRRKGKEGLDEEVDFINHKYDVEAEEIKTRAARQRWTDEEREESLRLNENARKSALAQLKEIQAQEEAGAAKSKAIAAENAAYAANMNVERMGVSGKSESDIDFEAAKQRELESQFNYWQKKANFDRERLSGLDAEALKRGFAEGATIDDTGDAKKIMEELTGKDWYEQSRMGVKGWQEWAKKELANFARAQAQADNLLAQMQKKMGEIAPDASLRFDEKGLIVGGTYSAAIDKDAANKKAALKTQDAAAKTLSTNLDAQEQATYAAGIAGREREQTEQLLRYGKQRVAAEKERAEAEEKATKEAERRDAAQARLDDEFTRHQQRANNAKQRKADSTQNERARINAKFDALESVEDYIEDGVQDNEIKGIAQSLVNFSRNADNRAESQALWREVKAAINASSDNAQAARQDARKVQQEMKQIRAREARRANAKL